MNIIESMKSKRWGCDPNFKPKSFNSKDLVSHINENKPLMWCECLSERHYPDQIITKLYLDRDLKREEQPYNELEKQKDFELCLEKINKAFGDCEWAMSQRHGYNPDKNLHCISWHFVCLDLFIEYTQIPLLLEQKGLDDIFDTAVYKSSEQLWQLPWCHKTPTDKRILTPINYKVQFQNHFIQCTSPPDPVNIIKIEVKEEHKRKKAKTYHSPETTEISFNSSSDSKKIAKLQNLLEKVAKDTTSQWYKQEIQENGNETHFYKTKRVRTCWVCPNEKHKSNNFVLNIRGNKVYYKCMSKECIKLMPRCLGIIESNSSIPKLEETNEWLLDTNDILLFRNAINQLLSEQMMMPKSCSQEQVKKINKQSADTLVKLLNKFFVCVLNGIHSEIIMIEYSESTGQVKKYTRTTYKTICNHYADIKMELDIWHKHPNKRRFEGITYDANTNNIPNNCFNLWLPPRVVLENKVPNECDQSQIELWLKHIKQVFAANDEQLYQFIINWIAYPIQHPGVKIPNALVMTSGQGTGKTLFWSEFIGQLMYGDNYAFIDNIQSMIGQFNSMSCMKQLVVADELESFGGYQGSAQLKGLIGNTKCKWESKGMNAVTIPNFASYVFLSNCKSPVLIEQTDRHYTLCELNETFREDREYFQALTKYLTIESAGHFYKYLMELDLSDFDYRSPYTTEAKKNLIHENTPSIIKFVNHLKQHNTLHEYTDTNDFFKAYVEFSDDYSNNVKKISIEMAKHFGYKTTTYKKKVDNEWVSARKYLF